MQVNRIQWLWQPRVSAFWTAVQWQHMVQQCPTIPMVMSRHLRWDLRKHAKCAMCRVCIRRCWLRSEPPSGSWQREEQRLDKVDRCFFFISPMHRDLWIQREIKHKRTAGHDKNYNGALDGSTNIEALGFWSDSLGVLYIYIFGYTWTTFCLDLQMRDGENQWKLFVAVAKLQQSIQSIFIIFILFENQRLQEPRRKSLYSISKCVRSRHVRHMNMNSWQTGSSWSWELQLFRKSCAQTKDNEQGSLCFSSSSLIPVGTAMLWICTAQSCGHFRLQLSVAGCLGVFGTHPYSQPCIRLKMVNGSLWLIVLHSATLGSKIDW